VKKTGGFCDANADAKTLPKPLGEPELVKTFKKKTRNGDKRGKTDKQASQDLLLEGGDYIERPGKSSPNRTKVGPRLVYLFMVGVRVPQRESDKKELHWED